jgi:hypothetical protein
MGMGGGVIQQAFAQAMSPNAYVNPSMFNAYSTQQPTPYQPIGSGYSTAQSGAAGGDLAGRYEIRKMAQGGLAAAADHLASKGRGSDSTLVHMTPGEVQSLQAIAKAHGGSLTINPNTGLYEAGFLKNILPMVAGIGLSMIPGVGPLAAAGIVGGFETVRTGDISKGLMAGLGAYGGAGIGSALTSAGTNAGLSAASAEAATAGELAGSQALQGSGYEAMKNAGLSDEMIRQSATDFAADNVGQTFTNAAGSPVNIMSGPSVGVPRADMANLVTQQGTPFSQATQNMLNNPTTTGFKQLGSLDGMKNVYNAMPTGTVPALATTAASAMTPTQEVPEVKEDPSSGRYLSKDFQAYVPNTPNPYYRPRGLGYTGYAAGGMVDPMQQMPNGGLAAIQGMRDSYSPAVNQFGEIPQFNEGGSLRMKRMQIGDGIFKDTNPNTAKLGAAEAAEYYVKTAAKKNKVPYTKMPKTNIEDLGDIEVGPVKRAAMGGSIGGYSDGGRMLKGPGDGMSDSIPGIIGKRQPARLADGEFVVPADVVSHLGNGSTDAGAKRLYAMMDKVRHARTGNKKQGKKIKPEKYMPA